MVLVELTRKWKKKVGQLQNNERVAMNTTELRGKVSHNYDRLFCEILYMYVICWKNAFFLVIFDYLLSFSFFFMLWISGKFCGTDKWNVCLYLNFSFWTKKYVWEVIEISSWKGEACTSAWFEYNLTCVTSLGPM